MQDSQESANAVSHALTRVLHDHGWQCSEQPARLRAMLNDVLASAASDSRAAVDGIVLGAQQGVPAALAARTSSPTQLEDLTGGLISWGLHSDMANWVVNVWAWAWQSVSALPATDAAPSTQPPMLAATVLPVEAAVVPGFSEPPLGATVLPPAVGDSGRMGATALGSDAPGAATSGSRAAHRRLALVGAGAAALLLLGGGLALAESHSGGSKNAADESAVGLISPATVAATPSPSAVTSAPPTSVSVSKPAVKSTAKKASPHATSKAPTTAPAAPAQGGGSVQQAPGPVVVAPAVKAPGGGTTTQAPAPVKVAPVKKPTTKAPAPKPVVTTPASVPAPAAPVSIPPAAPAPAPAPVTASQTTTLQLQWYSPAGCSAAGPATGRLCQNPVNIGGITGDWTTLTIASGPSWGSAYVSGGQIFYTAVSNTPGTDHLTYYVTNAAGQSSNVSTLTIHTVAAGQ